MENRGGEVVAIIKLLTGHMRRYDMSTDCFKVENTSGQELFSIKLISVPRRGSGQRIKYEVSRSNK